jgi:hypothetical protein
MNMENSLNENGLDNEKILSNDDGLSKEELDNLTTEERKEFDILDCFPDSIMNSPPEKRIELLKKYKLYNDNGLFKNIWENNGEYKKDLSTLSEVKEEFLSLINNDNLETEIEKLKKRIVIDDKDYVSILTECSLTNDKGYKKTEDDGLTYTYLMNLENCRKYVYENMDYIQLYGRSGIYNIYSKTLDDYRKSRDILKRIKVLQIKKTKDKETYSFEGLDKFYFLDEKNKNYKLTWNPNKDKFYIENKVNYFNEYSPIQYQGINHGKDLSLIYYHIKHYLCSDNENVYQYFISIISDMIRNPGRKLPICVVMNGEGGVGKSFLFDKLFRKLFGDMYGFRSNKVSGRFNKELENKICFLIEELSHQDNKNESNIIKDMVSNPKIRIERKGIDSYEIENCIRFFICSNGEWSVRIENNNSSRRYLVCDVSDEIPDYEYFNKLSELIKGDKRKGYENETILRETIEQFIYDMEQIDLLILENDPPETESRKLSQSFSKGIPEKQLESFFEKIINEDGFYNNINNHSQILDNDNDYEINSSIFWDCFVDFLKDRRQQIPDGFSNYGRILSKWFGKDYSKLDTKMKDGKRNRILTFPKIEDVDVILSNLL